MNPQNNKDGSGQTETDSIKKTFILKKGGRSTPTANHEHFTMIDAPSTETDDYELQFCPIHGTMTNHLNGICQKTPDVPGDHGTETDDPSGNKGVTKDLPSATGTVAPSAIQELLNYCRLHYGSNGISDEYEEELRSRIGRFSHHQTEQAALEARMDEERGFPLRFERLLTKEYTEGLNLDMTGHGALDFVKFVSKDRLAELERLKEQSLPTNKDKEE